VFPGSAYPKKISQQCTPATHTEAVHCQGVFLITKGSWIHLGGGLPSQHPHAAFNQAHKHLQPFKTCTANHVNGR